MTYHNLDNWFDVIDRRVDDAPSSVRTATDPEWADTRASYDHAPWRIWKYDTGHEAVTVRVELQDLGADGLPLPNTKCEVTRFIHLLFTRPVKETEIFD